MAGPVRWPGDRGGRIPSPPGKGHYAGGPRPTRITFPSCYSVCPSKHDFLCSAFSRPLTHFRLSRYPSYSPLPFLSSWPTTAHPSGICVPSTSKNKPPCAQAPLGAFPMTSSHEFRYAARAFNEASACCFQDNMDGYCVQHLALCVNISVG